eukprot:gene7157-7372_t
MEPAAKKQKIADAAAAAARGSPTPFTSYKQALKLVKTQQCGDNSSDPLIQKKLQLVIRQLSEDNHSGFTTVQHSLDLDLQDEPLFLLASAHLQLGLLLQRQDNLIEAQQQLQQSLQYFPNYVAAHAALGLVLKSSAASACELQQAELHLQQAVQAAEQLQAQQEGLWVDVNKACAAELDAADAARSALSMLLCQAGRDDEAATHLQALGFKFRLSREVLHYTIPVEQPAAAGIQSSNATAADSSRFLQVVDHAVPQELLHHLQQAFAPSAPFWSEHCYGRVGYFSYFFALDAPRTSSMHQLAQHLQQLAARYFPAVAEAKYAEFWAHCRRHSSGHQLHFDSDDEGQGGVRNPIISTVLYLSTHSGNDSGLESDQLQSAGATHHTDNSSSSSSNDDCRQDFVGGPTLVTNQELGGSLATHGWLAFPAVNRLTMFDGRFLHGVVPGRGPSPSTEGRRCTLMVAFWKKLQCRRLSASRRLVRPRAQLEQTQKADAASASPSQVFDSLDYEQLAPGNPQECPHGAVKGLMRAASTVLTAKTNEKLEDLIPRLNKVSGLPVVDANNRVIGVISRKDHMTSPAVTVGPDTSVRRAAEIMLKQRIRRLPVVDKQGVAIGLLSRSDIFKPLLKEDYDAFEQKERAAMASGAGVQATWDVKYLYDGDCAMCRSLKNVLERQDKRRGLISFIDISNPYYDPYANMGIEFEDAMETIHAIKRDGKVLMGTDALRLLFTTVDLGWAVDIMEVPIINKLVDLLYEFLSANRISLGNALDGIIAAKRIDMSKQGVETCGDVDEECTIEW